MVKLDLKEIKELRNRLTAEDKEIVDEFIEVTREIDDIEELDDYVDLLLGVADNIDDVDQKIIYSLIDKIQS